MEKPVSEFDQLELLFTEAAWAAHELFKIAGHENVTLLVDAFRAGIAYELRLHYGTFEEASTHVDVSRQTISNWTRMWRQREKKSL
jgi:hypothetical protein